MLADALTFGFPPPGVTLSMLTKPLALFGNIRNLRAAPDDSSREGPIAAEVAKLRQRDQYGGPWIFGVEGAF
jgi:hypothetical protein